MTLNCFTTRKQDTRNDLCQNVYRIDDVERIMERISPICGIGNTPKNNELM